MPESSPRPAPDRANHPDARSTDPRQTMSSACSTRRTRRRCPLGAGEVPLPNSAAASRHLWSPPQSTSHPQSAAYRRHTRPSAPPQSASAYSPAPATRAPTPQLPPAASARLRRQPLESGFSWVLRSRRPVNDVFGSTAFPANRPADDDGRQITSNHKPALVARAHRFGKPLLFLAVINNGNSGSDGLENPRCILGGCNRPLCRRRRILCPDAPRHVDETVRALREMDEILRKFRIPG